MARRPRRGARRPPARPARGDPPARGRGPRLRRGGRRARHHPAGRPRARAPRPGRAAPPTLRRQEHPMTDLTPRLAELGDALERAARRDLRPAPRRRSRRGVLLAALVALVAVPGAAVAAISLISEDEVAQSIPAGTLWLAGHRADLHRRHPGRRVPLHARQGARRRDRRLDRHGRADGRRDAARQRRLPLAERRGDRVVAATSARPPSSSRSSAPASSASGRWDPASAERSRL